MFYGYLSNELISLSSDADTKRSNGPSIFLKQSTPHYTISLVGAVGREKRKHLAETPTNVPFDSKISVSQEKLGLDLRANISRRRRILLKAQTASQTKKIPGNLDFFSNSTLSSGSLESAFLPERP